MANPGHRKNWLQHLTDLRGLAEWKIMPEPTLKRAMGLMQDIEEEISAELREAFEQGKMIGANRLDAASPAQTVNMTAAAPPRIVERPALHCGSCGSVLLLKSSSGAQAIVDHPIFEHANVHCPYEGMIYAIKLMVVTPTQQVHVPQFARDVLK